MNETIKKWEIFGYTPDLPSIIIEAECFDNALKKARQSNQNYCGGRVYDEKIGLINPPKNN